MLFVLGVWHQNQNPQIPVAFRLERCFFPRILWAEQGYSVNRYRQRADFTSQPKQLGNVLTLGKTYFLKPQPVSEATKVEKERRPWKRGITQACDASNIL